MRSTKNCLWDLKPSAKYNSRNFNTLNFSTFLNLFFKNFFSLMRLTWADYKMTTTETAVLLPDKHLKQTIPIKNVNKSDIYQKCVLLGTQRGRGGGIWVLLCSQRGGKKKIFEKWIVFGVFGTCQNAKSYQLFEKIFRVPPPPNTVTPNCLSPPPPPVACP